MNRDGPPGVAGIPRLLSLNVGVPKHVPWHGKTVYTGIVKYPVDGPRMVRKLNIDGDSQGDLNGHGAEAEVTQPRVTCFRVGMRLGEPEMASLLVAHHRPGFYFRVITEGHVQASDEIIRTRIDPHRMSVATIDILLYLAARPTGWLRCAVDGSLTHGGPCISWLEVRSRRHGLGLHGGKFAWSAADPRARGLPRLALMAPQSRGHHSGPRRRTAAAATMRARIERRSHSAAKRAHQRRGPCRPTQRGTCSLNPRRHRLRGDGLATPPWSPATRPKT
ncbi:MAG: MOSC domain-containing protein [Pseudonocardiaceae bacterium]